MRKTIEEDVTSVVPANAAGSGGVEGIGVGLKGEPGVTNKKKLREILRRRPTPGVTNGRGKI